MAEYTVSTSSSIAAVNLTDAFTAVAASDEFVNNGRTVLYVNNASGGDITVTVVTTRTIGGLALADSTFTATDGKITVHGPYNKADYDDANGKVTVQYSATTSVTAAVLSSTSNPT